MEKANKNLTFYKPKCKEEILDIVEQIKNGLSYLHKNNISHRDIKPDNILIFNIFGKINVKIADFGISQYTKKFIKNDYYSLGYIIYYLVTGVNLFDKYTSELFFSGKKSSHIIDMIYDNFTKLGYLELIEFTKNCIIKSPIEISDGVGNGYILSVYKNNNNFDIKSIINELNIIDNKLGYDIIFKMLQFYIINFNISEDIKLTKFIISLYTNLNINYYKFNLQEYDKLYKTLKEEMKLTWGTFNEYDMFSEYYKFYYILDNCNGMINNYSLYDTPFRDISKIESLDDYNFIFKYFLKI